ncbi:MAG: glycosyltransferase, partial [Devosiaceae bacterium]|nr:glycosyltransferase [Devosiaceae bacterium]
HGYVDISGQLDFLSRSNLTDNQGLAFVEKNSASKKLASGMIANSLDSMQRKNLNNVGPIYRRQLDYIKKMDFSKTEYVLVSTQNRPYKNTLGAIKALERYNLNADRPLKLIMTGDYGIDDTHSPVGSYVRKNGLYFDVLAIPRVPDDVHAALYHCATLALAASFFEGGTGSFVFDEAVSVGTPALLSHNLSHDEGLQGYKAYSTFTFNPNDPQKLAELIKSTLSQPEGNLYKTQWDIASNRMQKRSWEIVQKEYLEAFNQTINIRKPG